MFVHVFVEIKYDRIHVHNILHTHERLSNRSVRHLIFSCVHFFCSEREKERLNETEEILSLKRRKSNEIGCIRRIRKDLISFRY